MLNELLSSISGLVTAYWFIVAALVFFVLLARLSVVKVEEGTAKFLIAPGGRYDRTIFNWKDYIQAANDFENNEITVKKGDILKKRVLEENNVQIGKDVKAKKDLKVPGTSWFFRIPFWHRVEEINISLTGDHEGPEGTFNSLDLREVKLKSEISRTAGTPPGASENDRVSSSRVDVDVKYLVILRIRNPYEFYWDSPTNGYEDALSRLDNMLGHIISQCEPNLLESMQGSHKPLWYGIRNPDNIDYSQKYSDMDDEDREELKETHREVWEKYSKDISNPQEVKELFEGLRDSRLIRRKLSEWGIEIIMQGTEFETVEIPQELKDYRDEIQQQIMKKEKTEREKDVAEVNADIKRIQGRAERDSEYAAMRSVDDIAKLLRKYGSENPVSMATEIYKARKAAKDGNLKSIDISGLEGGIIPQLAAQLGLSKEMMNLFKEGKGGDIGFKPSSDDNDDQSDNDDDDSITVKLNGESYNI